MIEGRGKIVDPHTVSVQGKNYTVGSLYLSCYPFSSEPDMLLYQHGEKILAIYSCKLELGCCCFSCYF